MSKRKNPDCCWKVHAPSLLEEIVKGSGQGIYKIPINMLLRLLCGVAERAAEINDPELNALMCKLSLYAVADPYDKENYDAAVVTQVLTLADEIQRKRAKRKKTK